MLSTVLISQIENNNYYRTYIILYYDFKHEILKYDIYSIVSARPPFLSNCWIDVYEFSRSRRQQPFIL